VQLGSWSDFEVKITTRPNSIKITLSAQYLANQLRKFQQIYNFGAIWDKDELISF